MSFEIKDWVGDKQIGFAEEMTDRLDIDGNPLIRVTYIQGGVEYFSKPMLDAIATKEASDATDLRTRRCYVMAQDIIKILTRYGFKTAEFDFLYQTLKGTIEYRMGQAETYLWGVDDQNLSFLDLTQVLAKRDAELHATKEETRN